MVCLFRILFTSTLLAQCWCASADCLESSFLDTYQNGFKKNASFIYIKAKRLGDYHHGAKLKVIDNYSTVSLKDTIVVWFCNPLTPMACEDYDSQADHQPNDTLLCILMPTDLNGNIVTCQSCPGGEDTLDIEQPEDYRVITCSPSILSISAGKVRGMIFSTGDTIISYEKFVGLLNSLSGLPAESTTDYLTCFPVPASDILYITSNVPGKGVILDLNAKAVATFIAPGAGDLYAIRVGHLPKGVYLAEVTTAGRTLRIRIVLQ